MKVTLYSIKFNTDDRRYEAEVLRNVEVSDFDDYLSIVTIKGLVSSHSKQMKLDTVEYINENGYFVTTSSLNDRDCFNKIINSMIKKSTCIISVENDKLELLSQISKNI